MGRRRWIMFLLLLSIPLLGFAGAVQATSGPYSVECQNVSPGFQITLSSMRTGQTSFYEVPFASCPP